MSSLLGGGSGSGIAGLARVAFESTGVGQVTQDLERVERTYRASAGEMSDSALRVQLAQDRLQRSLRKGPAAFREQANAELSLRRAERDLRQETDALTRSTVRHDRATSGLRGRTAGLLGSFTALRGGVGALSVGFLGGAGLTAGFVSSLNAASSLEEEVSKARVTFGAASSDVERFATTTSRSIGVARVDALAYSSTLGGILNASGLVRAESAKLGTQFVQLGGDMASFNNASPAETLEAIRSGLVGEYEPLRRYQVLLSEARVSQEALRLSGKASKDELTEREKILARVNLILKGTVDQQGDAARTSANYAGQMRRLNAQLRDLQTSAGTLALPVMTDFVEMLNEGTGAANRFAGALGRLGNISIPGAGTDIGAFALGIAKYAGPYSTFFNAQRVLGLFGDDDDPAERDPIGTRGDRDRPGMGRAVPRRRRQGPRRTMADVLLDIARAEATPDTRDDVRTHRELRDRLQRQVNALERRKNLTAEQKQKLRGLYGELAAEEAALAAIAGDAEQKLAAERERRAEEAARKRRAAVEKAEAQLERHNKAAEAYEERLARAGRGRGGMPMGERLKALQEQRKKAAAAQKGDAAKGLTAADVRRELMDLIRGLNSLREFSSNFAPDPHTGRIASHASTQTDVLVSIDRGIQQLQRGAWHPGSQYVGNELAVAGTGVGF